MKSLEQLKEKLKSDVDFRNKFHGIKGVGEAVSLARSFGFDVNEKDIENDYNLSEDVLEAVAAGKGDTKAQVVNVQVVVTGKGSRGEHWGQIDQNWKKNNLGEF